MEGSMIRISFTVKLLNWQIIMNWLIVKCVWCKFENFSRQSLLYEFFLIWWFITVVSIQAFFSTTEPANYFWWEITAHWHCWILGRAKCIFYQEKTWRLYMGKRTVTSREWKAGPQPSWRCVDQTKNNSKIC